MSTVKFAGEVNLSIQGDRKEFGEDTTVCAIPACSDDCYFPDWVAEPIEETDKYKKLTDGFYHVYYEGHIIYEESYSWEYGVYDYDAIIELNYIEFEKLDDEPYFWENE